jgi:ABC-2 type transport system permease protein
MKTVISALWAETLKARRSKILLLTAVGLLLLPLAGGLFMVILKDPEQARAMGLINQKARLAAGTADWPSFLSMIAQGGAGLEAVVFTLITAWVFGREFSDHTVKELLALPTSRSVIVGAKFALTILWCLVLAIATYLAGLAVGSAVGIPGWSLELGRSSLGAIMLVATFTIMLMPLVAFAASIGRGYLPPIGWTVLTLALANIAVTLGWGDWFPWAIPLVVARGVTPDAEPVGLHSVLVVCVTFLAGLTSTFAWWHRADQTR